MQCPHRYIHSSVCKIYTKWRKVLTLFYIMLFFSLKDVNWRSFYRDIYLILFLVSSVSVFQNLHNISLCSCTFIYQSLNDKHFDCVLVFIITQNVSVNILTHEYWCILRVHPSAKFLVRILPRQRACIFLKSIHVAVVDLPSAGQSFWSGNPSAVVYSKCENTCRSYTWKRTCIQNIYIKNSYTQ